MSINFYKKMGKNKKLMTVKYPMKEDNSDWEYVIVDKQDTKEAEKYIKDGNIKDMKTIIYNTKQLIQRNKDANSKN